MMRGRSSALRRRGSQYAYELTVPVPTATPEPSTLLLAAMGLLGLAGLRLAETEVTWLYVRAAVPAVPCSRDPGHDE